MAPVCPNLALAALTALARRRGWARATTKMSQALWHYALESQRGGEGRLGSVCTARACRMNSCLRTPSDGSGVPETRRIQHIARGYASITRYCVPPMPRGSVFVFFSAGRAQSRDISHSGALMHKCHSHYSKIGHKTAANTAHCTRLR